MPGLASPGCSNCPVLVTEKAPRSENSPPRCRKSSPILITSRAAAPATRAGFRDHDRDHDHGRSPRSGQMRCSVIMPGTMITEDRTCRPRTHSTPDRELSPTIPEKAPPILITSHPTAPRGGCRVTRDRLRGSISGTLRDNQAGARPGPAARPATESGRPGCWSRPPLTAAWPSLPRRGRAGARRGRAGARRTSARTRRLTHQDPESPDNLPDLGDLP